MFPSLTASVIFLITGPWVSAVVASPRPRVITTSGILNGISNGSVDVFLGVRYSEPPVGDLRWRTALPVDASGIEVNATQFGAACGQYETTLDIFLKAGISTLPTKQSEDCLFLKHLGSQVWRSASRHRFSSWGRLCERFKQ